MDRQTVETATVGQCIPWFCATTRTGKEIMLAAAMQSVGIQTYVPVETIRTYRPATKFNGVKGYRESYAKPVDKDRAWFPSYLFARMDDRAWSIAKTQLRRLVGAAILPRWVDLGTGSPIQIEEEVIAMIAEHLRAPQSRERFQAGDKLTITAGPLMGHEAIYSHDTNERVYAFINLLGRQAVVPFLLGDVRETFSTDTYQRNAD